jgi:hypothetical protein
MREHPTDAPRSPERVRPEIFEDETKKSCGHMKNRGERAPTIIIFGSTPNLTLRIDLSFLGRDLFFLT